MRNLNVIDLKAFVPALDFETSKRFYSALGCELQHESPKLAVFALGSCRFYLQDFYVKEFAEQYMLHLTVEDVESWYQHVLEVLDNFSANSDGLPRIFSSPKAEAYGAKVCYVSDPTGVLIHIAQFDT
jgi:catechol 2,3-dioxygenase-like lactoylglutathione lyase family enzyme